MSRVAFALAALAIAALSLAPIGGASRAEAQGQAPRCAGIDGLEAGLDAVGARLFREMSMPWRGVSAQAHLWVTPSGDWSLLVVGNGVGCILLSGTDFRLPSGSL